MVRGGAERVGVDLGALQRVVLTQIMDLSYEDAAAIVGCPVGTIRSRVFRARGDLSSTVARREAN